MQHFLQEFLHSNPDEQRYMGEMFAGAVYFYRFSC